jgi:membrane peptidoglycan carboxypeptidase
MAEGNSKERAPDRGAPHLLTRIVVRSGGVVAIVVALAVIASLATLPAIMPAAGLVKSTADHYGDIPPLPGFLPKPPERSVILAADGSVLANLYLNEDRKIVKLEDIPKRVQQAVLAIEDSRFYEHEGVDFKGIARALLANAEAGGVSQGGSTLTQQYVKLVVTGKEVTLERKVREAAYALELEKRLGKAQILERYLNLAYFGEGIYGIATAAEHYFSKPLNKLSLSEVAALAATIARPETYKPTNVKANNTRRLLVLQRMQELGWEKPADLAAARKAVPTIKKSKAPDRFPYFYTYIRSLLLTDKAYDKILGPAGSKQRERAVFQGGLRIRTTLVPRLQKYAEQAVKRQLAPVGKKGPTGALASVDPDTGAVVALVGGRDYGKSEVNLAVLGRGGQGYQPGSAFKPFFAIAALEQGLSPHMVLNTPGSITIGGRCGGRRGWTVRGGADQLGGAGRIDMYEATARSVNVYYAQVAEKVGPEAGVEVARKLGISSVPKKDSKDYGVHWAVCSSVLGTGNVSVLDMASAFGVLANDGVRCPQHTITDITGPDGKTLWKHKSDCDRALEERISRTATDMLKGGPARGTGTRAQIGRPLAGKTGTAQNYTSSFFSGYTPQLATAVWVGNPRKPTPMTHEFHGGPVFGGTYPALIFADFMRNALRGKPVVGFPPPPAQATVAMPGLIGKSKDEALGILRGLGFSVDVTGKGEAVVATSPKAGFRLGRGSQVGIELGKKPEATPTALVLPVPPRTGVMPDVTGMFYPQAAAVLAAAGIGTRVRTVNTNDSGEFGRVLRQNPDGGDKVKGGTVATLWVGRPEP